MTELKATQGLLMLSLILNLVFLTGCDAFAPPIVVVHQGFETSWEEWQKGSDVPHDSTTRQAVEWSIEFSTARAAEGNGSARFFLDGRQGDGTIWLTRPLIVPRGRPLVVTVSLQLWSSSRNDNTSANVVAYAGPLLPIEEAEFLRKEPADKVSGWRRYQFTISVGSAEGELWVGFGISVAWKTTLDYFIDDVRVEIR